MTKAIEYSVFYHTVSSMMVDGGVDIEHPWGLGVPFPDAIDKVLYQIIEDELPKDNVGNWLNPWVTVEHCPWLFSPHRDTLIRVRLIQLGYLTKNDDLS